MSGLSMLTSTYLDVWFGETPIYKKDRHRAYIVHDVDSGMIPPLPEHAVSADPATGSIIAAERSLPVDVIKEEQEKVLLRLGGILGWYGSEDNPAQKQEKINLEKAVLLHEIWAVQDLLLALEKR